MADILGLKPRTALIVGGGAAALGVVYFWWRGRQAKTAASSGASSTGCTDGSGNSVPCPDASGIDYSGQLSVIQTELESLLSAESTEPATVPAGGSDNDGTVRPGGGSGPPPGGVDGPGAFRGRPGMPGGVRASSVTSSGFRASWGKVNGATSYQWRITYQGRLVKSGTVSGTSMSVSGLTRNHTYTLHVKACNNTGCSAETNGPAVHTTG